MTDGGRPRGHLKAEKKGNFVSNGRRSKQESSQNDVCQQLRKQVLAGDEQELQEIRSIERAGHRRRQRWLNDKILRDMAGPLTARSMEALFNPVPFGSYPPPSAFELAMHEPHWEHFRNIDLEEQDKVLQRWEQHNRRQQQQQHISFPGPGPLTQHQQQAAAAADALSRWRAVGRSARAALKKANVHSVLELEMQVAGVAEQADPHAKLLLHLPDGFARLIVHGLAQFHDLVSTTRLVNGDKYVVVSKKTTQLQQQSQHVAVTSALQVSDEDPADRQAAPVPGNLVANSLVADSTRNGSSSDFHSTTAAVGAVESQSAEGGGKGADWLMQHVAVTCTDVVIALKELGGSFDQPNLMTFMKSHVHGSIASSDDFSML